MKSCLTVAVTGILGSGKTTVSKIFKKMGVTVISCDEIVRKLLEKKEIIEKVRRIFGDTVIKNGKINKKKVREIIFENQEYRKKLENLIHPLVFKKIKETLDRRKKQGIIVLEIPLLFETKSEKLFDKIIVVKAPEEEIKKRLSKKYSEEEIEKIWESQLPLNYKEKKADYVIDNSGSFSMTEKQVKEIMNSLTTTICKGGKHE